MTPAFPTKDLERLAGRVLNGEVVFFVGAGFSLDSEGNTAGRLIAPLLARFEAMTEFFLSAKELPVKAAAGAEPDKIVASLRETAHQLTDGLLRTFYLERAAEAPVMLTKKNVKSLVDAYYTINDWMCNALSDLAAALDQLSDLPPALQAIHHREN